MEIFKMVAVIFALAPILGMTWIVVRPIIYIIAFPTYVGIQYVEQMLGVNGNGFFVLRKPTKERHKVVMRYGNYSIYAYILNSVQRYYRKNTFNIT